MSKRRMTYLIGEPGSGKTTVSQLIFKGLPRKVKSVPYVTWTEYHPRLCQIGHDRETFGGTDALSMAAQKKVIAWLEDESRHQYVYGEGDRLANQKFFEWARKLFDLQVFCLWGPETSAKRREKRNAKIGKEQNDTWLAGRLTKVERLTELYVPEDRVLDCSEPAKVLAKQIVQNSNVGRAVRKIRNSS